VENPDREAPMTLPIFSWCYYHKCPTEEVRERQVTVDHRLVLVCSGVYELELDGQRLSAYPGDIVLLRDGESRADWNRAGTVLEFFVIEFRWQQLPREWPLLRRDTNGRI
jgi:hypothetical protein